jgi:hypothetical protein
VPAQMKVRTRVSRAGAYALVMVTGTAGAVPARADVLTVNAKGTIGASCGMTLTHDFGAVNLNAAGSAGGTASVTCNQPFKMNAKSINGSIKNSQPASAPLTNTVPYSLKADILLDDASVRTATCASATLVTGQSSCALSPANATGLTSNGKIATGKTTTLTLSWTPPAPPTHLRTGSYGDTITLTIGTVP